MKIRVMCTMTECKQAQGFYRALGLQSNVRYVTVSEPYPNRGSVGYYRVYIDIDYNDGSNLYSNVPPQNETTLPDRIVDIDDEAPF